MKSFFLPIGNAAGKSLPTILAALSCGAARRVSGLDILHICNAEPESMLPSLVQDLNGDCPLFYSSFQFLAFRPQLPSLSELSSDPASSALIGALRGKGIPLSYKTDREAVEWAFASLLDCPDPSSPLVDWTDRIRASLETGEEVRICLLCDLCDPFSAGAAFALIRHLRGVVSDNKAFLSMLCLSKRSSPASDLENVTLSDALRAMDEQHLVARPGQSELSPADACWLLSLPSFLNQADGSWRIIYVAIARVLGQLCSAGKAPAPGLHTLEVPGILTLQSLGEQAKPFAAFVHCSAWLLSDLFPALRT